MGRVGASVFIYRGYIWEDTAGGPIIKPRLLIYATRHRADGGSTYQLAVAAALVELAAAPDLAQSLLLQGLVAQILLVVLARLLLFHAPTQPRRQ